MSVIAALLSAGASFLFLFTVFRPLELAFPAKTQKFLRPGFVTDLCFYLGQYVLWNAAVFWVLGKINPHLAGLVGANFRAAVAAQPFWLQAIEAFILSDLLIYWGHRIQHRVPFLW